MAKILTDLQKLSNDVYRGIPVMFNEISGEDAIRNAINAVVGEDFARGYRANKPAFFELLEQLLEFPMGGDIEGMFGNLVGEERVGLADSYAITIPDTNLLKVAKVAVSNNNLRRQKIYDKTVTVTSFELQIKIYESYLKFASGKINWTNFVNTAKRSMTRRIEEEILNAFVSSYSLLNASYGITGALTEAKLTEQINKVKAKTGMDVAIYGTSGALGKIASAQLIATPTIIADSQKESYASLKHFGKFGSTQLVELPMVFKTGTEVFAMDDSTLFILPVATELIKVIYFGDVYFDESTDGVKRKDRQVEFLMSQGMGIAVLMSNYYSIYKVV